MLNKMLLHLPLNYVDHQVMAKLILLMLLLVTGSLPTWAQPAAADDIEQLQKQMYQLYNKSDESAFTTNGAFLKIKEKSPLTV